MIQALLPSILPAVTDVIGRFLPEDKEARAKAERDLEAQLATHLAKIDIAQLEINKAEASHRSVFVAGWRPAIGWICALGLLYNTIIANIISIWVGVPEVDTTLLVPVMMGMLGLGAMRSYEKVNSVAREK